MTTQETAWWPLPGDYASLSEDTDRRRRTERAGVYDNTRSLTLRGGSASKRLRKASDGRVR